MNDKVYTVQMLCHVGWRVGEGTLLSPAPKIWKESAVLVALFLHSLAVALVSNLLANTSPPIGDAVHINALLEVPF